MNDSVNLKKTVLHAYHVSRNANMASFGGYSMPLWYETGAKAEHLAVITAAGLFDTSHMAVITISGEGAFDLLQHSFTRDLNSCVGSSQAPLSKGRCVYGLFLETDGTVIDDAIVTELGAGRYMVVVNSGMGPVVSDHLRKLATAGVSITDHSDMIGKIDLQGPRSALIIEQVLDRPDAVLDGLSYFTCRGDIFGERGSDVTLGGSIPVLLSRSGYTGEFGFELFTALADTENVWRLILEAGEPFGITVCGLASRDSLRTGAMLPLSHQDIGNWKFGQTPWSFVLPKNGRGATFTKQFVGADSLLGEPGSYTYGFAGYDPRKIPVTESSRVVDADGSEIGIILTCTTDMAIDRVGDDRQRIVSVATPAAEGRPGDFRPRGLCCGFIKTNTPCRIGDKIKLVEGRRTLNVEIREDIRPNRTARCSMQRMRSKSKERETRA